MAICTRLGVDFLHEFMYTVSCIIMCDCVYIGLKIVEK